MLVSNVMMLKRPPIVIGDTSLSRKREAFVITEPKVEERSTQHYVAIRTQATIQELSTVIPQLLEEVYAWLAKQGVAPAGAPLIRYLIINMEAQLEVELGVPVAGAMSGNGRIRSEVLPAGLYASLLFIGPYDNGGLVEANAKLLTWGTQNGLRWDSWTTERGDEFGARIESYLTDPTTEPGTTKWQTEVAIRLAA